MGSEVTPEEAGRAAHLDRVRSLIRRGEPLEAYDLLGPLDDVDPSDPIQAELAYLSVLALVRSGAADRAEEQLGRLDLESTAAAGTLPPRLGEDIAAIRPRIAKDRALAATGETRRALSRTAARGYEAASERFGGSYACINAATMWLIAGEADRARTLATEALARCVTEDPDSYWTLATVAEARLLLGDVDGAADALARADRQSRGELAMRATTTRQLRMVAGHLGIDDRVLACLRNPRVLHFAGHRAAPVAGPARFPLGEVERVQRAVRDELTTHPASMGFGSLASGGDIIIAEELLAQGAELHVLLPFSTDEFVTVSVADGGREWEERFAACLDAAATVRFSSDGDYLGDPIMFDFCSSVAMGDAINRAVALDTVVEQLAVWDGREASPTAVAGTGRDVARWRALGLPGTVIDSGGTLTPSESSPDDVDDRGRVVRAMLFADIAGFSRLTDGQIPAFMNGVMGPIADCLDTFGAGVLTRQTWGDGLYLVFADVETAAECALAVQQVFESLDLVALGLSELRGMRIGGHVGPVFEGWDHVTREATFFGANVTRAARIEPRTPEGEVYVTHPFAALVGLARTTSLSCQYVGRLPAAKDYGVLPMYVLKHVG